MSDLQSLNVTQDKGTVDTGCNKMTYRQIYDNYTNWSFFGLMNEPLYTYMDSQERASRVDEGYIVNKPLDRIIKWNYPLNRLFYKVHDHIRICEEAMAGVFTTENKEFKLIFRRFMKEFMFGTVYVLYSEEFKDQEMSLLINLAKEKGEDPYDRYQKAYPNCNFRLLKRVPNQDGGYRWDAILSNVQNIEIDSKYEPARFSFNEGFMFIRLIEIFYEYESEFQIYKKLLMALATVGEITAEDQNQIYNKMEQFVSPEVFAHGVNGEDSSATTVEDLKLVDKMCNLTEFYQQVRMELMDKLGELGLGVDDTNKRERITVGENTRALQPTINFQNTILHELENVSNELQVRFGVMVQFMNTSEQREQRMTGLNQSKFNKYGMN